MYETNIYLLTCGFSTYTDNGESLYFNKNKYSFFVRKSIITSNLIFTYMRKTALHFYTNF